MTIPAHAPVDRSIDFRPREFSSVQLDEVAHADRLPALRLPMSAVPPLATKVLQRRLKSLLGRRACHLESVETLGKARHVNCDVMRTVCKDEVHRLCTVHFICFHEGRELIDVIF